METGHDRLPTEGDPGINGQMNDDGIGVEKELGNLQLTVLTIHTRMMHADASCQSLC